MNNKEARKLIQSLPRTPLGVPTDLIPLRYQGYAESLHRDSIISSYKWLFAPHKGGDFIENMRYAVFIEKWSLRAKVNYIGWTSAYLGRNILKYYYQDLGRVEFLYPKDFPTDYEIVKIVPGNISGASHSVLGKFYAPNGLIPRASKNLVFSGNFATYLARQIEDAIDLYSNSGIEFKDLNEAYEVVILRNVLLFTAFAKKGTTLAPSELNTAYNLLLSLREKYFKYLYNGD